MNKVQFIEMSADEHKRFTESHEDLNHLSKARFSLNMIKEQSEEELKQAENRGLDSDTIEWYENILESITSAYERIGKVNKMLFTAHYMEENK